MDHPLNSFLNPRSVAVIGVSPNWSYINTIFKHFVSLQTPPRVYPINPNYPEVEGLKCYARLTDVPADIELVVVSVPARLVPDAMQQCEQKGVKAVNIITSGFAEMGGAEGARRHQLMRDFVERTGIRIVGPNCYGNMSAPYKFAGMPNTERAVQRVGRLSLAFQSGGLAISMVSACIDRYMALAHVISSGNEVDIEIGDCLEYFADDEYTQVIGLYVEQFRNAERFVRAAERCAELRKPVVVLKTGRSEAGRKMAKAHTGALAGSDQVVDAVMKQYGITRVSSINEMLETVAALHARKLPKGQGVAAVTNSGGGNAVIADLAEELGLEFPPFAESSYPIIRKVLYDYITVTNPLDITGPGGVTDQHIHAAALDAMGSDPNMHVILHTLATNSRMDAQSAGGKILLDAMRKYPDKVFLKVSGTAGTFRDKPLGQPDPVEPIVELDGVPFMMGYDNVLRAVAALLRYAEFQRKRARQDNLARQHVPGPNVLRARGLVHAAAGAALTESEGKRLLSLYNIPVTRECIATSAEAAAHNADEIGYPIVLKIVSPQIMHKTEAGGVALNVQNADEARAAYTRIMQNARQYDSHAELQGVSVQEMVRGGHELIVGMTRDPQFGPAVLLGLGGIFVEVLKDVALRMPPLDQEDAHDMIDSLKGKAILKGARGAPPADIEALVSVLVNFSQLCLDLKDDVREIDINPLVLFEQGQGAKALDCLIVPA